ncbi:hypothetical protein HYALB_00005994 [Hymenoscyphus albidus]|uniref:Uncharacterized protein n=1 Tax=Hymenoscyphus albidus TaxID=595503 RepID=A0A9N9LNS3_9HELO|nr:hypothetical protein HYALB_00005994 [Hymenoscyphus albidus]
MFNLDAGANLHSTATPSSTQNPEKPAATARHLLESFRIPALAVPHGCVVRFLLSTLNLNRPEEPCSAFRVHAGSESLTDWRTLANTGEQAADLSSSPVPAR